MKPEVRSQKSEVRSQKSEVRSHKSELTEVILLAVIALLLVYAAIEQGFGSGWQNGQNRAAMDPQEAQK